MVTGPRSGNNSPDVSKLISALVKVLVWALKSWSKLSVGIKNFNSLTTKAVSFLMSRPSVAKPSGPTTPAVKVHGNPSQLLRSNEWWPGTVNVMVGSGMVSARSRAPPPANTTPPRIQTRASFIVSLLSLNPNSGHPVAGSTASGWFTQSGEHTLAVHLPTSHLRVNYLK